MPHRQLLLTFVFLVGLGPPFIMAQQGVVATGGEATGSGGTVQRSTGLTDFRFFSSHEGSVQYGMQPTLDVYSLNLFAVPAKGGSVHGEGAYHANLDVNLHANVNEGYELINWSDADGFFVSGETSFTYTMPAEQVTLTANFADLDDEGAAYSTLSLTQNNADFGTIHPAEGFYKLMPGQTITLTAIPKEGMVFLNWTCGDGTIISEDPSFDYTIAKGLHMLQANFRDATSVPLSAGAIFISLLLAGLFVAFRAYQSSQRVTTQ